MDLSVIIPAHNPDPGRLGRVLAGLNSQTLPLDRWETIIVDNASNPPVSERLSNIACPANLRIVSEPELGLTAARRRGFLEASTSLSLLVDDDNVLAPNYLEEVIRILSERPSLGAIGGKSVPEFENEPDPWQREFFGLLALRDLGANEVVAAGVKEQGKPLNEYPACAPIGAGMGLRTSAGRAWSEEIKKNLLRLSLDRRGPDLVSGGDNDLILTVLENGWDVGYFPSLSLTHLIPVERLDTGYLTRLNRAMQRSWVRVLDAHRVNPWRPIPGWTVPLRKTKAFLVHQAWKGGAHKIRWQGACGHYEGLSLAGRH